MEMKHEKNASIRCFVGEELTPSRALESVIHFFPRCVNCARLGAGGD